MVARWVKLTSLDNGMVPCVVSLALVGLWMKRPGDYARFLSMLGWYVRLEVRALLGCSGERVPEAGPEGCTEMVMRREV